jgi:hypothetical protein
MTVKIDIWYYSVSVYMPAFEARAPACVSINLLFLEA